MSDIEDLADRGSASANPSEMDKAIQRQRAALKRQERDAVGDIVTAYRKVEDRLFPEIDRLTKALEANPSSQTALFRLDRANALARQVKDELRRYATGTLGPTLDHAMLRAANTAVGDTEQLMLAGMGTPPDGVVIEGTFTRLPTREIETILGTTRTGPLAELLKSFGDVAAEQARTELVTGMALGHNPRKIGRRIKDVLGVNLHRANLIARTEINRAHRETSRATYRANRHIVTAYVWHAACDHRTCAACWALHGTEFDLDTPMGAHPACRCALIPKTKTWRELGYTNVPETSFTTPSGSDLFAAASSSTQKAVLGPRAFESYRNGEVDLIDFVRVRDSPRWGRSYTRGSLRDARLKHAP